MLGVYLYMKQMRRYLNICTMCSLLQLASISEWLLCKRRLAPTLPSFCSGSTPLAECLDTQNDDYASQSLVLYPCLKGTPVSDQPWSGRPDSKPPRLHTT